MPESRVLFRRLMLLLPVCKELEARRRLDDIAQPLVEYYRECNRKNIAEIDATSKAIRSGKRWWEPYPHETPAEKVEALVAACEYWHSAFENALDQRDWHEQRRARWTRAFNRLEKAVTNHMSKRCIDSDDLAHVHKTIMRDIGPRGSGS